MSWKIQINPASISKIQSKVIDVFKDPAITAALTKVIMEMPSIKQWMSFLDSQQFIEDFGVRPSRKSNIRDAFKNALIDGVERKVEGDKVYYQILDQKKLRAAGHTRWINKQKKTSIPVNIWDIYEYGRIGKSNAGGQIKGYSIDRNLQSEEDVDISRSGSALMRPGGSFSFYTGNAPTIFSVRSELLNRHDKFAAGIILGSTKKLRSRNDV
jgi:hypothetical protein